MPNRRMRDLVQGQDFVHVLPTFSIREASRTMAEHHIGAIAVLDANGALTGIFTERDLITRVVAPGLDPDTTPVSEVMTPNPQTIAGSDTVRTAMGKMKLNNIRHLVVCRDAQPVGMVSIRDFVGRELAELDKQTALEEQLWERVG